MVRLATASEAWAAPGSCLLVAHVPRAALEQRLLIFSGQRYSSARQRTGHAERQQAAAAGTAKRRIRVAEVNHGKGEQARPANPVQARASNRASTPDVRGT
jgi:hypothetical protein